jgi:hypothetical protein
MKKLLSILTALTLLLCASAVSAEAAEPFFAQFTGMEWNWSSGVGGWSAELRILPDGSFSGEYHDSEMGESGDSYPYGTVYTNSFTGRLVCVDQADEYSWIIRVDQLQPEHAAGTEWIDEGIRYVASGTFGITQGDEMKLYRPGTPFSAFTEDMIFWAHKEEQDSADELSRWFLTSSANNSGFVAYPGFVGMTLANPWQDLTQDQLREISGLTFGIPAEAQNVIWRYLPDQRLAEMQFTFGGGDFTARVMPAVQENGELPNISGMYFSWENVEQVTVAGHAGTLSQAKTGSTDYVELCQWYDADAGLMYTLSATVTDPNGLDLVALAEQVYIPGQQAR